MVYNSRAERYKKIKSKHLKRLISSALIFCSMCCCLTLKHTVIITPGINKHNYTLITRILNKGILTISNLRKRGTRIWQRIYTELKYSISTGTRMNSNRSIDAFLYSSNSFSLTSSLIFKTFNLVEI